MSIVSWFAALHLTTAMIGGMTLRGAVVGCGAISAFHLAGWRRIPEVDYAEVFYQASPKSQKNAHCHNV